LAHVVVTYQYRSADGQHVVLDHAPAAMPPYWAHLLVQFAVGWTNGRWTVQRADAPPLDAQLISAITQPLVDFITAAHGVAYQMALSWDSVVAVPPAAGCLVVGRPASGTPIVSIPPVLLFRLGVLLAVNASAQRLFPELPVASADEQALAQQLAANMPGG
jgi:hypothetical protein